MKQAYHLIILCAGLALMAGCSGKPTSDSTPKLTETVRTARHNLDVGMEYDNKRHQMRLAELYYRKSYETLKENPSQAWDIYAEAGYRYACLLSQRGDMEGALAIVSDMLKKAENNEQFPGALKAHLLSLMAECQLHLAMPETAKRTFEQAYEHQQNVLGGREKGDFNLAILCSNIFMSFFEMGEYNEAAKWLSRYEEELRACERLGVGDSLIISEHNGLLALYKAQYLQATGQDVDAAAVYAAIPRSHLANPSCIETAAAYLMAAGRYAEAADMYARLDTTFVAVDSSHTTFDKITLGLAPRYVANRRAGRIAEALEAADKTNAAIDSALAWQKQNDAAELAVIYQTHERELALEESQAKTTFYRIISVSAILIILLIVYLLWRSYKYNKVLTEKNRRLLEEIEQREHEQQQAIEQLEAAPEAELTTEQQLYRRLCELMKQPDIFTDPDTNQDTLARLLGTNRTYIYDALRECADQTPADFINSYRLRHAVHLLGTTNDSVALIAELCGLSRPTFYRLFSETYGMSPSDYREVAKK